ncbi:hypothetical protein JTE90_004892 [Oedothorax gibbosus]|uniref:Uncharacterized protein n=1 Tax=Oedothorax gibbosus TaxID=931172 RepID=A0AAV6TKA9_9ARAC|nr:hypothetical protein JTE90_004892 [Oedothorax gibbosus]
MKPALLFCFWVVSTTISTNRGIPATLEAEAGTSQAAVETTLSPEDQSNSPSKQSKIPSLRIHIEIQIDHSSTKGTRVVLTLQPLPDTLALLQPQCPQFNRCLVVMQHTYICHSLRPTQSMNPASCGGSRTAFNSDATDANRSAVRVSGQDNRNRWYSCGSKKSFQIK